MQKYEFFAQHIIYPFQPFVRYKTAFLELFWYNYIESIIILYSLHPGDENFPFRTRCCFTQVPFSYVLLHLNADLGRIINQL